MWSASFFAAVARLEAGTGKEASEPGQQADGEADSSLLARSGSANNSERMETGSAQVAGC
jgi:hypothetical protein